MCQGSMLNDVLFTAYFYKSVALRFKMTVTREAQT